jgi:DNA-binding NarL/FixJ family response regulator
LVFLGGQGIAHEGLQRLLRDCPECGVLETTDSVETAELLARQLPPELIVLGFGQPLCLVDATRRLCAAAPESRILVLSTHAADPAISRLLAAELERAGACGLLPSTITSQQLRDALHDCLAGRPLNLSGLSGRDGVPTLAPTDSLTRRQEQVLRLIAQGLLNKEIAGQLGISIKTVEKHRQGVKGRLHAANTADLTRRAIQMGLA